MKLHLLSNYNEIYTPQQAIDYIVPYLPKDKIYREMCYGEGHFADGLRKHGYSVIGKKERDCFVENPKCDIIITNPPFKGNIKFIQRAIELGKPFVFLLRLEHLGGVGPFNTFKDLDIEILIPKQRIHYITPKILRGEKTGGSTYHSIFITYGLGIGKTITYIDLPTNT